MDDLRDYRFYAEDMIHPSSVAVDYIWGRLSDTYFDDKARLFVKEMERGMKAREHRPFNDKGEEYRAFLENNLKKLGTVVLLDASFEWIHNRLKTAKNAEAKLAKRPLFSDEKKAKALYKERKKAYKKLADVVVDVEGLTLDEQIAFIAKKCKV